MSRRYPVAKWTLPKVVDPPRRCFVVEVPNDRYHMAAFRGALLSLASAYKWADDPDHTAALVANVWRDIYSKVKQVDCNPLEPGIGIWEDFAMPIRVDCDCRVWVTCCDGTEVELATVGMIGQPTQPGAGSPQPAPGGGTANYDGCLDAAGTWLLPAPVSTGDVISISDVTGAWTGNSGATWNCPDGSYYFAGACVGGGTTSGTDPLPSVNHMRLILFLDGDYYDLMAGPVTVPAGVDTVQGFLLANDDDTAGNSGQVCFNVSITNNNTASWTHSLNFKTNTYGFVPNVDSGNNRSLWVAGQGWTAVYIAGGDYKYSFIQKPTTTFTLTGITPFFDMAGADAAASPNFVAYYNTDFDYNILETVTNGTNQSRTWAGSVSCNQLAFDLQVDQSGNTGTGAWIGLNITGSGPDPFASYF